MADDPIYILDANVFIEAKNRYYAFDLAPGFWDSLLNQWKAGRLHSIDRIKQELERGKDELATWAKSDFSNAFVASDGEAVIECYGRIMQWVHAQIQFTDPAKADFASGADGWLVAYSKVNKRVLVTHEVLKLDKKSKVQIPNVCSEFDVPYVDTFVMLRELGVRLT